VIQIKLQELIIWRVIPLCSTTHCTSDLGSCGQTGLRGLATPFIQPVLCTQ